MQHEIGKVGNPTKWPLLYEVFLCRLTFFFFLEIFRPSKLSFVWLSAAALRKSSLTFTTAIRAALSGLCRRTASSAIMMTDRELLVIDMKRRNMQL